MGNSGIYKIQSKQKPERIYIGSSNNFAKRESEHAYHLRKGDHHSIKLQYHYNKYGSIDLKFELIEICDVEQLNVREQFYLDTFRPFFNILPNARSTRGRKLSKEARLKIAESNKRRYISEETKEKHRLNGIGKKRSILSRKKQSEKILGRKFSEEHKRKISEALKGRKFSKEHIDKLTIIRKNRICSKETKLRMSEAKKGEKNSFFGKSHTLETRRKVSEGLRRYYANKKSA